MITLKKSKKIFFVIGAIVAGAAIYSSIKDKINDENNYEKRVNDYEEESTETEQNQEV